MRRLTMATAFAVAALGVPVAAQTPADHDAHHPDRKEAPAATQPTPPAGQPGMSGPQGMMGNGGMMDMMGGKTPMMDMMQMMRTMRQAGTEMDGMATIDHVEGRIAFLRTELKITDAQTGAWNAFADALRTNAKNLGEVRASMMPQAGAASQTLVDRLALQEKWLTARLEGTRAIKSAMTNLVTTFSDDQKKTADDILAPHMGMMAMMSAMQSGQMGPGQMQPGKMMPSR
jgi:hypothetical protein